MMTQEQTELIKEMYKFSAKHISHEVAAEIKDKFPDLFKPEKYEPKVGQWVYLKLTNDSIALIKFNEYGVNNYGFSFNGKWTNVFGCHLADTYYPATPQEVESRLRQYALDVLGIDDDTEIQEHVEYDGKSHQDINQLDFDSEYITKHDTLWNRNGRIYSNGKWAKKKDPIPDDLKQLIEKYGKETLSKYLK